MSQNPDMRARTVQRWYYVSLDATQLEAEEHARMKLLFEYSYLNASKPKYMTLWFAARPDGGADMYISPQSIINASFARRYNLKPCALPPETVFRIAGHRHRLKSPAVPNAQVSRGADSPRGLDATQ